MKKGAKIVLVVAGLVLVIGFAVGVYEKRKGIQPVQAAPVVRRDLTSLVSATGEIRPLTYTNVLAEGFGRITEIYVHEGQWVHQGDLLMRVDSVQPAADVRAQQAAIDSTQAAVRAAQANLRATQAVVAQRQADLDKARFDWEKGQSLFEDKLISRQDYEGLKSTFNSAQAAQAAAQAQLAQARAQQAQAQGTLDQAQAVLAHAQDVLSKTTYRAPIAGMVTYIAVRVGEDVVPGIQNAEGAYLMTISDMSVVTTEVFVDETDIVNIRKDQQVTVQIDALPGKSFAGHVTEVGTQAIIRSSGLVTTQTTTGNAEAKDFKVVVTLDHPPSDLLPGLTTTAKIVTAQRSNVLAVPIQALVVRTRKQIQAAEKSAAASGGSTTMAAAPSQTNGNQADSLQGVFVVREGHAMFVPVQTGIMGVTDIEVTHGLKEGDQIIIGSFQTLRTLQTGAQVRIEQTPPTTS
jgi:HlyD family secretion protein